MSSILIAVISVAEVKIYKAAKRFGSRYGRRVRQKFAELEASARKRHKCPYCHSFKARRVSSGIWLCKNCNSKFAGKAYTLPKKIVVREEIPKEEKPKEEKPEKTNKKEKFKNKVEKEEEEEK